MPDVTQPGITFEHVWKRFCRTERHTALRDVIPSLINRAVRPGHELKKSEFWALKDVSLDPRQGEALGIIGPNGAGKSTVLKLLTKILRPTEGRCELRGRVGALIEVAAGFHPDLTGRENVDLQGAIMGMKRAEIARKFDQIVEFSGIADFIDAPVRRYSSGMNARLGFAIAAHLEPEVLIVDEVLAVGDFAFQQRAFGRIQEMINRNVTTIIVSHQLERIAFLCKRAVLLRQGEVAHSGPAAETIAAYVSGITQGTQDNSADCPLVIRGVELVTDGRTLSGSRILIRVDADVIDPARLAETSGVGVRVRSMQNGKVLFATSSLRQGLTLEEVTRFTLEVSLQLNTAPGVYTIETGVFDRKRNQPIATGPWVNVTVCDGKSFAGEVQMNPEMVLRSPASANEWGPAGALRPLTPSETIHAPSGSRDRF
jgi:ABC-type polysaccharide/polyol phosphate transport system ATPase subunit